MADDVNQLLMAPHIMFKRGDVEIACQNEIGRASCRERVS
jgi:hypothetical protein